MKPARKHSCWKDKPELRMEQGKCKEVLCKEAETLPPINVSGDSDDERNSRISLETMDTDQCIQKLVRTDQEGSECAQHKIEKTVQYWAAQEKKAAMNYLLRNMCAVGSKWYEFKLEYFSLLSVRQKQLMSLPRIL